MAVVKTYPLAVKVGTQTITLGTAFANRKAAAAAAKSLRTSPQVVTTPGSPAPATRQVAVQVVTKAAPVQTNSRIEKK